MKYIFILLLIPFSLLSQQLRTCGYRASDKPGDCLGWVTQGLTITQVTNLPKVSIMSPFYDVIDGISETDCTIGNNGTPLYHVLCGPNSTGTSWVAYGGSGGSGTMSWPNNIGIALYGGNNTWGNSLGLVTNINILGSDNNIPSEKAVRTAIDEISSPHYSIVGWSATPTIDMAIAKSFKITLTGDVTTLSFPTITAGIGVTIIICQDSTGGHFLTWPSTIHGGIVIGYQKNKCSVQDFISDGVNLYARTLGVIDQ
jgi:hypothetical protein